MTRDIDFTSSDQDEHYRRELEELAEQKGPAFLHDMLAKVDPKSAEDIHENNVKRVIRAWNFINRTVPGSPNIMKNRRSIPVPMHWLISS